MPLVSALPSDYKFFFAIKVRKGRKIRYDVVIMSGHIKEENFAEHVEKWSAGKLTMVPGAYGPSYTSRLKGKEVFHVLSQIGFTCHNCCNMETTMDWCTGCTFARYCSGACQKAHWKSVHKAQCNHIQRVFAKDATRAPERPGHVWYGPLSEYDFNLWKYIWCQKLPTGDLR